MKHKQRLIRWELVTAVAIAYAIVLSASFYFYYSISTNIGRIQATTYHAQEKLDIPHVIESQVQKVEQIKTSYFVVNDQLSFQNIATFQDEIEDAIRNLRAGYESTSLLSKQIDNLDRTIAPIINLKEVERQKNEDFDKNKRDLIAEQNLVSRHLRTIRETIINLRDEQNDAIYTAAKRTKTLAYIAIGLPLLFILYIARRVIRINKQLRINNHVAEELNKEYKFAQEKINMTNWVLKEAN